MGRSEEPLRELVREWVRKFKATPAEASEALDAIDQGLAEPFTDETWDRYWWRETNAAGYTPSKYRFRQWISTLPPRFEIAVALDLSRQNPANFAPSNVWFQKPLLYDTAEVDVALRGPRTRSKEREGLHVSGPLALSGTEYANPRTHVRP